MATVEEEDDRLSYSFLFYDFMGYTSMHGAGRIVASRQWIRKVFWIILIMAALGVSSWQVHSLYRTYQRRPLTTHVVIEHDTSLPFPVITICDMNALRKDELIKLKAGESLRHQLEERSPLNSSSDQEPPTPPSVDQLENLTGENQGEEQLDEQLDIGFKDRELLRAKIAEHDVKDLIPIGHQFEDFVVYCNFRGVPCANFSSPFWHRFWHYTYGNCYVFNGGNKEHGKKKHILKSNEPGPSHGLSLELNIEQDQYIGAITQEAGVRVDISNQGEMPFPENKGLSLAPGYATSIGMRKVVVNRQDPLSKNLCMKNSTSDHINIYELTMGVNYSTTACKKSCWAISQRERCGCMEYKFPKFADIPVCSTLNKTVGNCLKKVKNDFTHGKLNCSSSCPPPCRESTFKLTTSYSLWPTKSYEEYYKKELKKRTKEVDGKDNFRANVLKLNIFFEELNYEVISEELSYELANFVSDLGGTLGLWIGMSVLSFAEIFELLLLMCYTLARKLNKRMNAKSSTIAVEMFAQ